MSIQLTDIKLKLLSGMPMDVMGIGSVKPLRLSEIAKIGFGTYTQYLGILTTPLAKYPELEKVPNIEKFTILDYSLALQGETQDLVTQALELFLHDEVIPIEHQGYFVGNDKQRLVVNDNFLQLLDILRLQNMVVSPENMHPEEEFKPKDERAAKIAEKIRSAREKVSKAKKVADPNKDLDLADIISAVSTRSSTINKFNVWDLTLYQLYDEYNRLRMIDDYSISIKAMLAGAQKVKLRHWSERMESK